jgi:hypothetical protein
MKRIMLAGLFSAALFAQTATWDGTQGSVTVKTIALYGESTATIIQVSSSDPTVTWLLVTAFVSKPGSLLHDTIVRIVQANALPSKPQAAVFPMSEDKIDSITVLELRAGQTQKFARLAGR